MWLKRKKIEEVKEATVDDSYSNGLKVLSYKEPEIPTTKISVSGEYIFSFDPNKMEKRTQRTWGWWSHSGEIPTVYQFVLYIAVDISYRIDDNQEEYILKKKIEIDYNEEEIDIYRTMVQQIENGAVTIRNNIVDAVRKDYENKLKEKNLEEMKEIIQNNQTMKIEFTDLVQKIS